MQRMQLDQVGQVAVLKFNHPEVMNAVGAQMLEDFAEMADIELLIIDENTSIREFKKEIRWNDMYYQLAEGLKR